MYGSLRGRADSGSEQMIIERGDHEGMGVKVKVKGVIAKRG